MARFNLIILLTLYFCGFYSQEPVFSQFDLNPNYLNPALAGSDNNYKISTNQRYQWTGIPSQFNTTAISIDSWQDLSNSAFTMLYTRNNEGEGALTTTNFSSGLAYRLFDKRRSPIKMQFGFQYHHLVKRIDWSKLVFSDELDAVYGDVFSSSFIPPDINRYTLNNMSLGYVLEYRIRKGLTKIGRSFSNFDMDSELGVAWHNVIQREDGFIFPQYLLPWKFTIHGSFLFSINHKKGYTGLKPNFMHQWQGEMKTTELGLITMMYPLHYGVFYRNQSSSIITDYKRFETFGFIMGYKKIFSNNICVTFSFSKDFTISELTGRKSRGTNEVVLVIESIKGGIFSGLRNEKRKNKFKNRSIPCYDKFNTRSVINTRMGPLNPNPNFKTNNN